MNITETMSTAVLSELLGGLFFTQHRTPILKEDLANHLARIKVKKGDQVYYHLDETTSLMTEYRRNRKGGYQYLTLELPLRDVRKLVNATESAKGYNLKLRRFRTSMWHEHWEDKLCN